MPNWAKKARRKARPVLMPSETVGAAVFVRPRDNGTTRALGAPALRSNDPEALPQDAATLADSVPSQNRVLALTEQRLLTFGHNPLTGGIRKLETEFDRRQIADISLDVDAGMALEVVFVDGSRWELTAGTRARSFVEFWHSGAALSH